MERQEIALQDNPLGIVPEKVLVIEIAGSVADFVNAVRRVEGLKWLGETEVDEIEPGYGFEDATDPARPISGQLFLVMTNQVALRQLLRLFRLWERDENATFPYGFGRWKRVFAQLRTIRNWDAKDRTDMTGVLEDWADRVRLGENQTVPFEAELWFRNSNRRRLQAEHYIRDVIESTGGEIVQQCVISEIGYHAILGTMSVAHVEEVVANSEVRLLQCEDVMFFRPLGQCALYGPEDPESPREDLSASEAKRFDFRPDLPSDSPVVAVFDGVPLDRHQVLDGRLIVDDPDDYSSHYQAHERRHGTAMASLLCHGDLNENNTPSKRPIYVRPIMQPKTTFDGRTLEFIPDDVLPIDLIHRAVRRIFVGDGPEPPVAPSIRIINLSICDRFRPFAGAISPWARLLDWIAYEYNVLFIISAGNHPHDLVLDIPREACARHL